jgi:hypothetical protein
MRRILSACCPRFAVPPNGSAAKLRPRDATTPRAEHSCPQSGSPRPSASAACWAARRRLGVVVQAFPQPRAGLLFPERGSIVGVHQ